MKTASVLVLVLASLVGLVASWYWWQSAKLRAPDFSRIGSFVDANGQAPANQWVAEAARLNMKAAALTALSVLLGAIAGLLSAAT